MEKSGGLRKQAPHLTSLLAPGGKNCAHNLQWLGRMGKSK